MKGCLRSWKFCEVVPMSLHGVAGWRKRRLLHTRLIIPPGNLVLDGMDSGCQIVDRGWADHEKKLFRLAHPDDPQPVSLDHRTIWLPHLRGMELRELPTLTGILSAFAELGRFHRLGNHALHGDPHAGNFLYDEVDRRCRIIDFETIGPASMPPALTRARDFSILALDIWKTCGGTQPPLDLWLEAYGRDDDFCPAPALFRRPGRRLRTYWFLLGYRLPPAIP